MGCAAPVTFKIMKPSLLPKQLTLAESITDITGPCILLMVEITKTSHPLLSLTKTESDPAERLANVFVEE